NPAMNIEGPSAGNVPQTFSVAGWAIDHGASAGTGVDTVHVYAYPSSAAGILTGAPAIDLGLATYGVSRPDIGAYFGSSQFNNSGYSLQISSLSPGYYWLFVSAHSTISGAIQTAYSLVQQTTSNLAMNIEA